MSVSNGFRSCLGLGFGCVVVVIVVVIVVVGLVVVVVLRLMRDSDDVKSWRLAITLHIAQVCCRILHRRSGRSGRRFALHARRVVVLVVVKSRVAVLVHVVVVVVVLYSWSSSCSSSALSLSSSCSLRPLTRTRTKHGSRRLVTRGLRMNQHVASFRFRCC